MASPVGSVYVQLGIDSAEFQRGLKSAQASAKVFSAAIDRSARDFRALENALDPATAALRQFERAQETAAQAVRHGTATQEQANAVLDRARARYESFTGTMTRTSTRGAGSASEMGNAFQQAGFQVGDFAVQIASGQSPLRAFIQQGAQMVSMFGPWGAVIGAAGAVVGALAVALWDTSDAAEAAKDALEGIGSDISSLKSARGALISVVDRYASSITDTGSASSLAAAVILANSEKEFNARKKLLELEQKIVIARRGTATAALAAKRESLSALVAEPPVDRGLSLRAARAEAAGRPLTDEQRAAFREQLAGSDTIKAEIEAHARKVDALRDEVERASAQMSLLDIQIDANKAALSMDFGDITAAQAEIPAGGGGGGSGGSGLGAGGGSSRQAAGAALADLNARLDALRQERELIGLTGAALAEKTAKIEANRIATAALEKIRAEGRAATPDELAQLQAFVAGYENLTLANYAAEEAIRAQTAATAAAEQRQDALAKSLASVADRLIGVVQNADSAKDAIRDLGLEILKMAAQGLGGKGPLGPLLGNLIPSLFAPAPTSFTASTSVSSSFGAFPNFTGGFAAGGYTGGQRGQVAGVVHGEEFVVQAGAARRHLPLLQAINRGLPGYAGGGFVAPVMPTVPALPRAGAMAGGGDGGTVVNIYGAPADTKVERSRRGGLEQVDVYLDEKIAKAMTQPGSRTQIAMETTYGARQAPIQR